MTAIERFTDNVMIKSVTDSVLSEDDREIHPSTEDSIHPWTDGPKGVRLQLLLSFGFIHGGLKVLLCV